MKQHHLEDTLRSGGGGGDTVVYAIELLMVGEV